MALLQARIGVTWVDLPTPEIEDYSAEYTHLEDSFIDALGGLNRDIIRLNRAKVFCGWKLLDGDQIALLQSLYTLKQFRLRFTDNFNNRVEKTMYAGPLTAKALIMNKTTFEITKRTQVQMNFIEV
jgi:hypothetical protein